MRSKIMLIVAVCCGILAFELTYRQIQAVKAEIRAQTHTYALVTLKANRLADEVVRAEDLQPREVQRRDGDISSNEVLWNQRDAIIGMKLSASVPAGRTLLFSDFAAPPRDRSFSARPKIGRRAYSIAVDTTSAVNFLIVPEDRVDLIGTFTLPDYKGDRSIDMVTVTLLENVKVLATGARWGTYYSMSPDMGGRSYTTVTLELLPEEVEIVSFAAQNGRLSLSLRNFQDSRMTDGSVSINFKTMLERLPELRKNRANLR